MRATIIALILAVSAGCGGAATRSAPVDSGDPASPPAMEALPSVARGEALSRRMRSAWRLAQHSFGLRCPSPPRQTDAATVGRWTDEELERWLQRKARAVEAAQQELSAAAEEAHVQRIVAGAVVGLMYEDIARGLEAIPVPKELRSEPEIEAIYRDNVAFRASPFVEHARRAYLACARNAIQPESMHHWSAFCAMRADALPPERYVPTEEGTTVTVSIDY